MKQIAQNYKTGELALLDVPVPACRPGGVLVRTDYSLVSAGTEMMKIEESKLSLLGKARARPDQVKKVLQTVAQQGVLATFRKVMDKLDSWTPLGYSLAGTVIEVGAGAEPFTVGQRVACAGNQYALHAEYNWVPVNLCVPVPDDVPLDQAAFTTVAAIALQGVRQAEPKLGESALVIGLGLVGQLLLQLLRANGVAVFGVDLSAERCALAVKLGAVAAGAPGSESLAAMEAALMAGTRGHGADHIFITAGGASNEPVELAVKLARDRARIVDIGKAKLDLPWNSYYEKELELRFSRSYGPGRYDPLYEEAGIDYPIGYVRWTEGRNMECVVDLLAQQKLDFAPLISTVAPFEQSVATYDKVNKGELSGLGILFRYPEAAPRVNRIAAPAVHGANSGKIRLGVIGSGNYAASMLLPHLKANPDVVLGEVATATGLSAANAQKKFGFARMSTDYRGVLADPNVDAVLIATRHNAHARMVVEALHAKKAVFVEKPLAVNAQQLDDIKQAVHDSGNARLQVGFNRRFAPLMQELKADWGPRSGPVAIRYQINAGPLAKGSWYLNSAEEGSRFVGEGCHFVDLCSWWLEAEPVAALAGGAGEDGNNIAAMLFYGDGSRAEISYLTEGDPAYPKEVFEVYGAGTVARLHNFQRTELWRGGKAKTRKAMGIDKGQKAELDAFVAALKTGSPLPIPLDSLYATTAATFAVDQAATSRTQVPVRW